MRAAALDMYEALDDLCRGMTEAHYRQMANKAICHNGICSIDECSECGRWIKALRALDKARGED